MRVATDVGGTFTDLVYCDYDEATGRSGAVVAVKCDTTPPDFERGVMQALGGPASRPPTSTSSPTARPWSSTR